MIYPHNPKFIFLHIAKAGGSSITKTLAQYLYINRDIYRPPQYKFLKIADLTNPNHFVSTGINLDDYYIFSCVRNPFDRLVSYFHYRKQIRKPPNQLPEDLTFPYWVISGQFQELTRMTDQLCVDGKPSLRINLIARLEQIDDHWDYICNDLKIETPLLHDKASKHEHYSNYYNDDTRRIVERHYESDLLTFGYGFESKK